MENTPTKNTNGQSQQSSSTTIAVSTQLPGIDNSQVIASQPYIIKENSSREQHREIKLDRD